MNRDLFLLNRHLAGFNFGIVEDGLPVLMVEQNARQALEIADRGYVLVQGRNAHTGTGKELLADPEVRASFLGG